MRIFVGILLLLLFALVVGTLCGRLMGVRLGRWRGLVVGTAGFVAGLFAAAYTVGEPSADGGRSLNPHGFGEWVGAVGAIVVFGVLAAMPVAIVVDLLTRGPADQRRSRRRPWLHPIRSIQAKLAPYRRGAEVVSNARKAGLLHLRYASRSALATPDLARRVRTVLDDSGGMLVKFGQLASTRTDILPEALTTELEGLLADVRPASAEGIRGVLEEELGEPVEQAFASFDWEPLAAASIGQTHRATLRDGTRVVVKVQRPGVDEVVARDGDALRLVARRLEKRSEAAHAVGLCALVEELIQGVEEELDYRHEASVGARLREHRESDLGVAVPQVYPTMSTGRVLVMEEVVGSSVRDVHALEASPVPRPELARRMLSSFLGQILEDGMYHADPHPGNVLIDAAGSIWLLDFGSVGRLDSNAVAALRGIGLGISTNDAYLLARAARDLATNDGLVDLRALEADISLELAELDGPPGVDPHLIGAVLNVMQRHDLRPPRSMTLLARMLLTLEGTLHILEPGFSVSKGSQELLTQEHWMAAGAPREIARKEALRLLPPLRTLPEHAEALADQLRSGRLTVRTERFAGADRMIVDSWVDRLVLAVVGGSLAIASALLLFAAASTENRDIQMSLWIIGFVSGGFATVVLMRVAARALRRHGGQID